MQSLFTKVDAVFSVVCSPLGAYTLAHQRKYTCGIGFYFRTIKNEDLQPMLIFFNQKFDDFIEHIFYNILHIQAKAVYRRSLVVSLIHKVDVFREVSLSGERVYFWEIDGS